MNRKGLFYNILCPFVAVVAGSLTGCSEPSEATAPRRANGDTRWLIVCTTGMVTDMVQQVAGEYAETVGLMGEGIDPHLYQPTFDDVARLNEADIVFYSGLMLEGQMGRTFSTLVSNGKLAYAVTADIPEAELRTPPEFEGHPDPHVWNDLGLWSRAVETVAARLAELDPEHGDAYRENAEAYQAKLLQLDEYVKEAIASIPQSQRYLCTAHDAFGYFGRRYGIPVQSVQGITTESEPGVDDINQLVEFLVTNTLPAIFVESSVNEANIRAVQEGARSRGHAVRIGGMLFSDAMGRAGTYEGTFIGMMDHNATTIARALGGNAPARGMNGMLTGGEY